MTRTLNNLMNAMRLWVCLLLLFSCLAQADIFTDTDDTQVLPPSLPIVKTSHVLFKPTEQTGKVAFTIAAEYAEPFSEGLAVVRVDGKYGFVDKKGKWVIKPIFDRANDFSEGYAAVLVGEKWGYIDQKGNMRIKPQFWKAEPFYEGRAGIRTTRDAHDCYVDKTGEIQFCSDAVVSIFTYSEGYARIRKTLYGKNGFVDKQGKVVIPEQFDHAANFKEGLAVMRVNAPTFKDSQYGYINKAGQVAIPVRYDEASDFSEGLAAVEIEEKWGYINRAGEMVIPPQFETAYEFSEGLARVELNEKVGFIDQKGKVVIPLKYDQANSFSGGLARVVDSYGMPAQFIDRRGAVHIQLKPDAEDWLAFSDGMLLLRLDGNGSRRFQYIMSH